jgi:hypothetical protein
LDGESAATSPAGRDPQVRRFVKLDGIEKIFADRDEIPAEKQQAASKRTRGTLEHLINWVEETRVNPFASWDEAIDRAAALALQVGPPRIGKGKAVDADKKKREERRQRRLKKGLRTPSQFAQKVHELGAKVRNHPKVKEAEKEIEQVFADYKSETSLTEEKDIVPDFAPFCPDKPYELIAYNNVTAKDAAEWKKRRREEDVKNPEEAKRRKVEAEERGEYDPESFRVRHRRIGFGYASQHAEDLPVDVDSVEVGGGRKGEVKGLGSYPSIAFSIEAYLSGAMIDRGKLLITNRKLAKWVRAQIQGKKPGYVKKQDKLTAEEFNALDAFVQRLALLLTHSEADRSVASYVTVPQILSLIALGSMTWLQAFDAISYAEQLAKAGTLTASAKKEDKGEGEKKEEKGEGEMKVEETTEDLMGYMDFGGGLFPQTMELAVPANRRAEEETKTLIGGAEQHYFGPLAPKTETGDELMIEYYRRTNALDKLYQETMHVDDDGVEGAVMSFWGLQEVEMKEESEEESKEESKAV